MKFIATAVFALIIGVGAVVVTDTPALAAEKKDNSQSSQGQQTEVTYDYTAQVGDSYSQLARKAVQTYGKKFKADLSLGQVLFIETNMTQQAGSPYLEVGQNISIKEADVKNWVEKAKALSEADKVAWETYVPYVDFNTDHVGQS